VARRQQTHQGSQKSGLDPDLRSQYPQLALFELSHDGWLLFKKLPEYAAHKKRRSADVIQLPIPELNIQAEAMSYQTNPVNHRIFVGRAIGFPGYSCKPYTQRLAGFDSICVYPVRIGCL